MDALPSVHQAGNSIVSFLLIPSIFVAFVAIGKMIDGLNSKPALFPYEAIITLVLALIIGIKSYNEQNKSEFTVGFMPKGYEGISSSLHLHNLSNRDITIELEVFSDKDKKTKPFVMEKHSIYKISQTSVMDILGDTEIGKYSLRIKANVKREELLVEAFNTSDNGKESVNVNRNK